MVIQCPQVKIVKKILILSLPYLGDISLQARIKLSKSFKSIFNCCTLQIVFKSQRKLAVFPFKDHLTFDLVSGVVYKYTSGRCNFFNYSEMNRHFKVRSEKHIGIWALTFRKAKPSKDCEILDHLLNCNNIPSFDKLTILAYGHHKYILEIKESLLVKHDRPVLNKNNSSAELFRFENNYNFECFYYTIIVFYYVIWYVGYNLSYVCQNTFRNRNKNFDFTNVKPFLNIVYSDVSRVFWGTPFSAGGLRVAVMPPMDPWHTLSGGPGGKAPESFWDFII